MSDHLPVILEVENANYSTITPNENHFLYRFTNRKNEITIENNSSFTSLNYSIISVDGKLIHKGVSNHKTTVKTFSNLTSGLYFCKIQLGNTISNKTFFVD